MSDSFTLRMTPQRFWEVIAQCDGNYTQAASTLGVHRNTVHRYVKEWATEKNDKPVLEDLPEGDFTAEEIIEMACKKFERLDRRERAKRWRTIKMPDNKPFALAFMGDPNIDNPGCNWPLLRDHLELFRNDGIYCVNIGDTTDNWIGRLMRLYAQSSITKQQSYKLIEWLVLDSGVDWLIWLIGNHDAWGDGAAILKAMVNKPRRILVEDWGAQFQLECPNKESFRIWATHNFPGSSIWNTLHGPQRAAHTKAEADVYVCGHFHNWGLHQEESASRSFTYWLARARGYKWYDDHAHVLGHEPQQEGATILAVFDPNSENQSSRVTCWADPFAGADYLEFLRAKHAKEGEKKS